MGSDRFESKGFPDETSEIGSAPVHMEDAESALLEAHERFPNRPSVFRDGNITKARIDIPAPDMRDSRFELATKSNVTVVTPTPGRKLSVTSQILCSISVQICRIGAP
jgi:hypothetical protein